MTASNIRNNMTTMKMIMEAAISDLKTKHCYEVVVERNKYLFLQNYSHLKWASSRMLLQMHIQSSLRPERPHASSMRADQFSHFSVHHEHVIKHLFKSSALHPANGTRRLPAVELQMIEQMKSVLVRFRVADLITDAAKLKLPERDGKA